MSVHYKFKSALDFDTITFDGLHISVSDLKKSIIHQKRLGKTADFDLQITNAQTKEEYTDDATLIPKNTSLIIARIPLAVQPKKPWDPQADKVQGVRQAPEPDSGTLDLSQMNGTEEDKIQAMMIQSTMDYDPNKFKHSYQKIRGQGQTGEVPANYRCFKCHKPGHWIKNCPLGSSGETVDIKRNTGIPRSFIERDSQEKNSEQQPQPPPPVPEKKQEIPEDLICSICKDLFTDAVMIPCCGSSFCDECVRTSLLESEDNECPDCKEKGSSPGSLIPNRFLRNSVNAFKNETGYNKPRQRKEPPKAREVAPAPVPTSTVNQTEEPSSSLEVPKEPKNKTEEKEKEMTKEKITKEKIIKEKITKEKITKEKKDSEVVEKKADPGALSSHDESDFEDNITVTVPPAHLQGPIGFKERQYNGRHGRHPRPPGIENSPKGSSTAHATSPSDRHRSGTPTVDEKEASGDGGEQPQKHQPVPSHHSSSRDRERDSMRPHRSTPSDMYNSGPPVGSYQNQPMMGPGRPYDMGVYGVPTGPGYPPYMMNDRMRGPYHPPRGGYPHMHPMRPRHMAPPGTLASVYQGVAAKVGTGIIDDPLEAFNRIMREKEKRKEERRRSPERRRSRSIEINLGRMRHSPPVYNRARIRSPEERRLRTPPSRERRGRSREREKRSMEREKHRHRSSSFSDRSSRSRSWSIPPRRRTKSPVVIRKRSRSRSPSFSMSRSRSRSNSQGRFRGPAPPLRYNRSPIRAISPRYRQKENRRPERREEFPREDFRERSPYHYQTRRPRSRGRMVSPGPHRQERPPVHMQEQFFHQAPMPGMYNEAPYSQNNNRYSRDPPVMLHREPYGRERNSDYKMERFDDGPQGPDEPPPPGFENSPERIRRNSWNLNQFDDHGYRDDYRNKDAPKKEYIERAHTPELHEMQCVEREERHRHEMRQREGRSWSRTSRHSSNNTRRRKTRSRSPVRMERIPEHFSARDRNPSKEKHATRDRYSAERAAHIEKERIEHEKRDRAERERKAPDKKHNDRKAHEKESRHTNKEEKEKEKEKHKEQEKEKEKRKDSSDEDKKDKKTKEKRKKKKEKDPEKKKKKEKKEKEKEKKLKEREKEREKEEMKAKEREAEEEKEKKKEQAIIREASVDKIKVITEEKQQDVEVPLEVMESEQSKPDEEDTPSQEEGEIPDEEEEKTSDEKTKEAEVIDLYGDICQEEEIRYEYNHSLSENSESEVKVSKDANKISPTEIKRFDSVLDIHDFEPDLEDIPKEDKRDAGVLVPLPELSKWEREEESQNREEKRPLSASDPYAGNEEKGKVTTEVIRRAENAIFARAINAIRPIEIKKISVERQKLYSNEPLRDLSSPPSMIIKSQSPSKDLPTFQITVPTNSSSAERSVEIKSEKQKRATPVRSVKDRLGSKVTEPPAKRNRSRSLTPPRKIALEGSRVEKVRPPKSRSRERHKMVEDAKDTRRGSEIRRANESTSSRIKERNQKDYKAPDNSRSREPSRNERRDTDRRRDNPQERSRERQYDQDRNREREREKEKEKEREKEKEKEKLKERRRTPERFERGRERPGDRERGRERERNIPRELERVRDRQPSSSRENRSKERPRSRQQERPRSKEQERAKPRQDKRERSRTRSSERKEKRNKREKDTKRKRSQDNLQEGEKKSKLEKIDADPKERNILRKKSLIDEANFVPDYDEQPDQEHSHKTSENSEQKTDRPPKEKAKSPESNKRSHSASPSSSSSSSSDSESNSDSEDNKKKKKRKHKKKKSKRASSAESAASAKRKRSKSKKKAKSAKKKKKSKK